MPVWKLCIALIRQYGFFSKLNNLDFTKLAPVIDKTVTIPLNDGTKLQIDYKELDKAIRTTLSMPALGFTHNNVSTSTKDPINDKPVQR